MSRYETITVATSDDGVATVTLDRPDVLNCFNSTMCAEFERLWPDLQADGDVRAIVLGASGQRAFSTGLDVNERLDTDGNPWLDEEHPFDELEDPGHQLGPKRNGVWKPVIAAIDGMCAGGAFYWVAECDIVICTPEATFFDPHVTYGLVAALEPIALTHRMNISDATRMALLGLHERMGAERALACGLVTEIANRDELASRAHWIASAIASQPTAAVQGTVKAIWQSLGVARTEAMGKALLYTHVGNPLGTRDLDREATRPAEWQRR